MGDMPVWLAAAISALSAIVVAGLSKTYDKFIESRYGAKRRLNEAELAVAVERAKSSNTAEGYLWKRIENLEATCDILRTDKGTLTTQLSKALDDYEEASRTATALAARVDELTRKITECKDENHRLVLRIVALETGKG